MKLSDVLELLDSESELRPIVEKAAVTLYSYGPLLRRLITDSVMASVDIRAEAVARFESKGFSHEEAIYMTMDQWWSMRQGIEQQMK